MNYTTLRHIWLELDHYANDLQKMKKLPNCTEEQSFLMNLSNQYGVTYSNIIIIAKTWASTSFNEPIPRTITQKIKIMGFPTTSEKLLFKNLL